MTKNELKELIRLVIKEYTGTGASGGNAGDGNNITSPRVGGSFYTDEQEIDDYTNKNVGYGAMGYHTRGIEKNKGYYNRDPRGGMFELKKSEEEIDEGTRCWKGYEKKGTKMMFGKRVPNCVKKKKKQYKKRGFLKIILYVYETIKVTKIYNLMRD